MEPYENLKEDIDKKSGETTGARNIVQSVKNLRKAQKGGYSVWVELLAVVAVFVFYTSTKGNEKSLTSFANTVITAEVIETGTTEYHGEEPNLAKLQYYIVLKYVYNSREYQKRLLFAKKPGYNEGDTCRIKISRINPEEVLLE